MVGFKALLAWHYLLLFSPTLVGGQGSFSFLFEQRMVLYLALAVAFAVVRITKERLVAFGSRPSNAIVLTVGLFSTASTAFALAVSPGSAFLQMVATAALGVGEGVFMFLWLHYIASSAAFSQRTLAIDMICGAAIGFFVCSLTSPVGYAVVVCLPFAAMVSLVANWRAIERDGGTEGQRERADRASNRLASKPDRARHGRLSLKTAEIVVPIVVLAVVFGMIQGSFLVNEVTLLMARDPIVLAGVVAAGIVIFLIPERLWLRAETDIMHRFSLVFFVPGMVGLVLFGDSSPLFVASEAAVLAGFNVFDFGILIMGIDVAENGLGASARGKFVSVRSIVYLSLAVGLFSGYAAASLQGMAYETIILFAVSGPSATLLVMTLLAAFREAERETCLLSSRDANGAGRKPVCLYDFVENGEARQPVKPLPDERVAAPDVAHAIKGSGGMIPPCLSMPDGSCPACRGEQEGSSSGPGSERGSQAGSFSSSFAPPPAPARPGGAGTLPDKAPTEVGPSDEAAGSGKGSVSRNGGAVREKRSAQARRQQDSPDDLRESPWRRTCRQVATLYQLSPRETEVFFLIAKGRNAEFVQQELVISAHTAKTHIAKIYHKLGVHSSQEMLTLIEAFREEDKKNRMRSAD